MLTNYLPSSSIVIIMIYLVSFLQKKMKLTYTTNIADLWFSSSLPNARINKINMNIISFVGEATQVNDISLRLVYIRTNVLEEEKAKEENHQIKKKK
ncbi:hypothetical protein GLOIN_2v1876087 [Rhizophagus clarus]|uniref:Uncharacterized protein n=1 Tax=Rhizophagus clarus TaxID=94130 RepID=A0A8H3QKL0_9GLOM|nr:hypothetical protein GLOIN_2v1876087 [Rhizophagus clarus]